jgi:hypothetical protein
MSWNFVYQELKSHLEDKEFVKKNLTANPNNPDDAIVVALYHLNKELSDKTTKMVKKEYGL